MCVSFFVAGSYTARWRPALSTGKSFADGWLEPALHSGGFAAGRTARALEAYDRGGAITWGADREATVAALVDAYAASRLDPEGAARTRAVPPAPGLQAREGTAFPSAP